MELRHLRYFVAVAEALSFRKAADILHISQPPLSMQIHDLERELGVDLFIRDKNRIKLTSGGEMFLSHAREILNDAERAKRQAKLAAEGKAGTIHIHFISSAVTGCLQCIVNKFKKSYPLVDIQLSQSTVEKIIGDVENGTIDAGFIRTPISGRVGLKITPILTESYYVALLASHILAKKKSISPRDLQDEKMIIYPRETASGSFDDILSIFSSKNIIPDIIQEAPEQLTIAGLVASGMGYSVVPECMVKIHIPGVVHRPLAGGKNRTGIAIITAKTTNALVSNFLDVALQAKETK